MESMDYLDLFRKHVPQAFLRKLLGTVYDCYADADDRCESLFDDREAEAENMRPFLRRAFIEQSIRKITKDFDGMAATVERGSIGDNGQLSWWRHTLVRCGPITFTQNTVSDPNELVRASQFRQEYAATNPQLYLFDKHAPNPQDESVASVDGIHLYGILLHGQSDRKALPGFVVIRFPNYDYTGYLPGSIDLLREFPEIVAGRIKQVSGGVVEVEQVEEPMPQLRLDRGQRGARA